MPQILNSIRPLFDRNTHSRITIARNANLRNSDSRNSDSRNTDSRNSDSRNTDSRNSDSRITDSRNTNARYNQDARPPKCVLFNSQVGVVFLLCLMCLPTGCRVFSYDDQSPNLVGHPPVQNPLIIPMMDRELVMEQVSDEIDNYFKIYRDQRIRVLDGIMSEGWIETHPKMGGTLAEPWKKDSTPGFEKLHATLQTVRRFAKVRVIPTGNSYQIDLKVLKELEELNQPVGATARGQLRFDNSLDRDQGNPWLKKQVEGWIPMGRDVSLEQEILRNIQQRLTRVTEEGLLIDVR